MDENTGLVTIVKAGSATITVTGSKQGYDGDTDEVVITVEKATPAAITVDGAVNNKLTITTSSFAPYDTIDLNQIVQRQGDGVISSVVSAANTDVATLDNNVVTLVGNTGSVTITISVAEGTNYLAPNNYGLIIEVVNP